MTTVAVVELGERGTVVHAGSGQIDALREQFATRHFVRLPRLLGPPLLDRLLHDIEECEFSTRVHEGVGIETGLARRARPVRALEFLANSPALFDLVTDVTGCDPIGCFDGRVFRMSAEVGHHDGWHDDWDGNRLVAMSVNLSAELYEGGSLQLRHRGSPGGQTIDNHGLGDALIFRIGSEFEHRIADLRGTRARTAYAGWFVSAPNFMDAIRRAPRPPG